MTQTTGMLIALSLVLGLMTACAKEDAQPLDASLPVITMSELLNDADQYRGKSVTVTGLFGGMCPDGLDFYFKDKLEIIEVIPPENGLPSDVVIGTPLKVQGLVLVRGEHEEEGEEEHEAGGEPESDVKIQATVVKTNRS